MFHINAKIATGVFVDEALHFFQPCSVKYISSDYNGVEVQIGHKSENEINIMAEKIKKSNGLIVLIWFFLFALSGP